MSRILPPRSAARTALRRPRQGAGRWRPFAALAALAVLAVSAGVVLAPAVPANAAGGPAVLNVGFTPVDSVTGAAQTDAEIGSHQDSVAYRVNYSCAVATCENTTIRISAPQQDPGGLVPADGLPTTPMPDTLLSFSSWTPPFAGATETGTDATGITVSLGDIAAGDSNSFVVIYKIQNRALLRNNSGSVAATLSPAQYYPDGFSIEMSATIDADNSTKAMTADAASVSWHNQVPTPGIVADNPGNQLPGVNVAYQVRFGSGSFALGGGNITGNATYVAAGSYTVVDQLPPEAELVSVKLLNGADDPLDPTYDAVNHTITWNDGTKADPHYDAGGGWGVTTNPNGTWNRRGTYSPRVITVTYPVANFAGAPSAPDADGCNFADPVTNTVSATVNYLDPAQTTVSTDPVSQNYTVQCWTPFSQAENGGKGTDEYNTTNPDGNRAYWVAPDTSGMVCPASGRDDWGRSCTPGGAVAAFATRSGNWWVEAYNEANIPGVAVITDDDLQGPDGAPVVSIGTDGGNASIASIQYTLKDGTTGATTGNYSGSAANPVVKAVVTSTEIPAAVNGPSNPSNARKSFVVSFNYQVTSSIPDGATWSNTASTQMTYPPDPTVPLDDGLPTIDLGTASSTVDFDAAPYLPLFQASQPSAPVVAGGGNPVPGTNVTFTVAGQARTALNGSASGSSPVGGMPDGKEITPEYVFIAPVGWTIPQDTAPTFTGTVPAGVRFHYETVTIAGQPRELVAASWPNTVTFADDGTVWPTMSVVAQPTTAAGNTTAAATMWIGDSRDQFSSTTANFVAGAQNTVDANGDGQTDQWFSTVSSTAVFVSGVAGLSVVKSICQPDITQPDGCNWVSSPGSVVGVSTDATDIKYRITVTNTGSAPVTNAVAYDVLPYTGDTGTSEATAGTSRGSTFDETLTSVSDVSAGVMLDYSASTNPCRDEVYPDAPGCVPGWAATAPADAVAIRATVASLAAKASVSFTYDAGVGTGALADALGCNSVAVASDQTLPAEPQAVCASTEQADLALSTPSRLPLQAGRPGVVPFTVVNHGGSQLSPATVSVDIPDGLSVTDLAPAGYSCADAAGDDAPIAGPVTLTCLAVNSDDGSTRSLEKETPDPLAIAVEVDADASGRLCVDGTVSGPLPDPDAANNDAESCMTVAAAPADGGIAVTKDDGVTAVTVGAQTVYTITVANQLVDEAVPGAVLTDTLPAGEQFVTATGGGTASGQTVTWNLADLAAAGVANGNGDGVTGGEGSAITVTVTAELLGSAVNSVTNAAAVTAPDPADPTVTLTADNTDTDAVTNVFSGGDSISTPQNTPVTTPLADIVTTQGAPIDPSAVTEAVAPVHGSISIDATTGAVAYQPAAGYTGTDSYTVQACDTSVPVQCATEVVQVSVGPNVVTAVDDTATTAAVTPVTTDVRANDITETGQSLAAPTVVTEAAHGTTAVVGGEITYTPTAGWSGLDSYVYQVCDTSTPSAVCDTATVTVSVANVFAVGPAGGTGIQTAQNVPIVTPLADIDTTTGSPLNPTTVTQEAPPDHGAIVIDPVTGAVTYSPTPGYTGPDSYEVNVCDTTSPTPQCDDATVAVTVLPNVVTAQDVTVGATEGTATDPIDVLTIATSLSGQSLNDPTVQTDPAHGSAAIQPDGTIVYIPDAGYLGTDSFTYTVCDTGVPDQACDTATITVLVTAPADPVVPPAAPSGLAFTGADASRGVWAGLILLLAGLSAVTFGLSRRRRRA